VKNKDVVSIVEIQRIRRVWQYGGATNKILNFNGLIRL